MKSIDKILNELGMDTPELPPINKREAIEGGLIETSRRPTRGICGKSAYNSQSSADAAIKHRLRQGFGGTSFLRSYFCQECGAWHMSSSHTKTNK
jgi:hypothetical protein